MDLYIEILGYIGTILVILSMMMTSMGKLRIINICGNMATLIYSLCHGAWAVAVMNSCIVVINVIHIVISCRRARECFYYRVNSNEVAVSVFFSAHERDIGKYSPALRTLVYSGEDVNMIYLSGEAIGIVVTRQEEATLRILGEYIIPEKRNTETGKALLKILKQQGNTKLNADVGSKAHDKYLLKLGFKKRGEQLSISF